VPPRKIIHIDADSFYASVEMREDPSLRELPIAVGGRAASRGVIATCNYQARAFGVRSAMPSSRALQLCPQLVILKPRFELYREVSAGFHRIFRDYTGVIEPLSLDEAYLDVTDCDQFNGSATLIAQDIRRRIREELRLTVSAGIAPNKFLAKVGSDWDKPDGCFTIAPGQVADFVRELPVSRINGVGAVTAARLEKLGVTTCGDLQQVPLETLVKRFGKYGPRLAELARGVDHRQVQPSRIRKSISVENTYSQDLPTLEQMATRLEAILQELHTRFSRIEQQYSPAKRFVKVKFDNFNQTTMEEVIPDSASHWLDRDAYQRLLAAAWQRGERPVRLLGAGLRLNPRGKEGDPQLNLFP
jgi:DNA polymerase-4